MMAFPAKIRLSTALAAVLVLGACGGDGTATTPTVTATTSPTPTPTPAPTPAPSPTPTPTGPTTADLNAVVQQVLTIDLAALDNYAAPALPAYYDDTVAALDNTPAGDPVDDAVATVGRVLFYDVALSVDDSVSCATCHQQAIGFDDDTQLSEGVASGQFTGAHAMRLGNVRYYAARDMFWDRRADSVEDQATVPILNPVEMGWQDNGGMAALVAKLEGLDYYPALFTFAFGDEAVTTERIERALAHFQRAMISADSRWDRAYAQVFAPAQPGRGLDQPLPGFSASENRGRQLFMDPPNAGGAGCAACHQPPTFALAANSGSNGLDRGETVIFKAPSLKSVGMSRFFMHDGRFSSLMQVIEHYDSGIQPGPALDNRLRGGGGPLRLNLSADDRQALVDFLLTLDDTTLAADPRFASPFR